MKVFYIKQKLITVTYRSYKNFSNEYLCSELSQVTTENNDLEFDISKAVLNEAIQKHAPLKQ